MSAKTPQSGRFTARLGFGLGIVATLAGNVGHAFVPPVSWVEANPSKDWAPEPGALIMASFWPLALVICVEVLARVDWGQSVEAVWFPVSVTGLVGLIAAIISYRHLYELMRFYSESGPAPILGPLAVDGLMAVCTVAMLRVAANIRAAEARVAQEEAERHRVEQEMAQAAQREVVHAVAHVDRAVEQSVVQESEPLAQIEPPRPARKVEQKPDREVERKSRRGGTDPAQLAYAVELVLTGGKSQREAEKLTGVDRRKIKAEVERLDQLATGTLPDPEPAEPQINGHQARELVEQH